MANKAHILKVSEFTKKTRFLLESELGTVWLTGEISNFIQASSGHWYLTLKDEKSQVRCAMFRGNNMRVRIKPKNGLQVLVRAKVSLYEPRGDFQLIIEQMEDAGEGLLQQEFERLKRLLSAQGLFSQEHKQLLPSSIYRVGVVTSPTGAAVKDILTVLQRRNPSIEVTIYPALVQGDQAAQQICQAIQKANLRNEVDVLIVGRGGGSTEDLWCFNNEHVVRAIFDSQLPIVSAVGHEVDTTLSDFVADVRAATPSAAAELVSSDKQQSLNMLHKANQAMAFAFNSLLQRHKDKEQTLTHRLFQCHPQQKIITQQQVSDELAQRLTSSFERLMSDKKAKPENLAHRLQQCSPASHIQQQQSRLSQSSQRLNHAINLIKDKKARTFAHLAEQLHIVSPLATIARGYSVTRNQSGAIVKNVEQVKEQEIVEVQLSDGKISAAVTSIEKSS